MERSYGLASSFKMLVEGFGLLYRFIEESVAETIRLCTYQTTSTLLYKTMPYQLMRRCGAFAERERDVFGAPCFRRNLLEDI